MIMEPYILTQADIDKLIAANISSASNAMPGEQATEQELQLLGITPAPTEVVETFAPPAPDVGPDLPVGVMPAASAAVAPAPTQNNMALIQQMLAAQAPPVQTDPYESLSKTQRRMLAFAGLSDAGAALQGQQGGSINNMMGRFNEQADMQRKATAAQAQRKMLQGLMGGGDAGGDPQARIQQLLNIAMVNPSMAPAIALQVKNIQDQLQAASTAEGQVSQASTQLEDVDDLLDLINNDSFMTTGVMGSIMSLVPGTDAATAEGIATTLRSNLALSSLKALKATGATMGALNTKEFNALEKELTELTLKNGPKYARRALKRIQTSYQNLIADAYRDAKEQSAAGNPMGQRALDGLTRIFGTEPDWVADSGPVVPTKLKFEIRPGAELSQDVQSLIEEFGN